MKKCYRCNKVVASNEKLCPYCGITLDGLDYCPKCKIKLEGKPKFCSNCGEILRTICRCCKKRLIGKPRICPYCNSLLR